MCIKVICACLHTASILWAIIYILSEAIITLGSKRLGKCLLVEEPTAKNHPATLHVQLFSRVETVSFLFQSSLKTLSCLLQNHQDVHPGCGGYKGSQQLILITGNLRLTEALQDTFKVKPEETSLWGFKIRFLVVETSVFRVTAMTQSGSTHSYMPECWETECELLAKSTLRLLGNLYD